MKLVNKIFKLLRDQRGVADIFLGFIAGIILFVLFYMFLCYWGFEAQGRFEEALNTTGWQNTMWYEIHKDNLNKFVQFLQILPALFFVSIIFYTIYRHFVEVSRGRRVR